MLRLVIFAIVVGLIFIRSPERKPEPAFDDRAASAATAALHAAATSPLAALEAARLAATARQTARDGIDQARRALAPPSGRP